MTEPIETEEKYLTNPSIIRLARKAGVKNFSANCYPVVHKMIEDELSRVIEITKIVNREKGTKTIMISDLCQALNLLGEHVTYSEKLNSHTTKKL